MQAAKLMRDIESVGELVALSGQDAAEVERLLLANAIPVRVSGGHAHPWQPLVGGSR